MDQEQIYKIELNQKELETLLQLLVLLPYHQSANFIQLINQQIIPQVPKPTVQETPKLTVVRDESDTNESNT